MNSCLEADSESHDGVCSSFDKFDVSNIPNTFLSDQNSLFMVNEAINSLEASLRTQADVDTAYGDWCKLVSSNMYSNLPYRTICIGNNNKKRRVGKSWWTNELSELWNRVSSAERKWINCHLRSEKARFKVEYVSVRKEFDRKVQRAK